MDNSSRILAALDGFGVPYELILHEPMWTIQNCLDLPQIDQATATMPRNIFLCNRQRTAFYLLLMAPLAPFRTAVVSKLLGVSRLSFAPEELLPDMLGLDAGAVSPLGLIFDSRQQVQLVMDSALLAYPSLWFHPGVNTASVKLSTADFLRSFLPSIGREATVIDLPVSGEE